MALTTKEQLKQVLDAVFNNGNPDTEYINSANTPSIKMYLNEMKKHADILEREEDINKYLVAILQTENHPYLNEGEVEYFSCKDIKDAILTTVDDLKEYNRGISSYIPMKRYIQNIGVFLGVSIADNIDEVQPLYYQDMVDIVKKYCTLNNKGLAYWGRYDVSNTPTYKSYVPVMCLVDIAIYLNNLGVFREDLDTIYWGGQPCILGFAADKGYSYTSSCTPWIQYLYNNEHIRDYIPGISDFYTINNKNKFIEDCKTHFDRMNYVDTYNMIDLLFNVYDNELDYDDILVLTIDSFGSNNTITQLSIRSYPKDCFIGNNASDYQQAIWSFNNKNDYEYIKYNATVDISTGVVTNSKSVYQRSKYTLPYSNILNYYTIVSNIKFNKLVARYHNEDVSVKWGWGNSRTYRKINGSYLGRLSNNTRYDNIKLSDGLFDTSEFVYNYLLNKKYNLFDGNKDLVITTHSSTSSYYYLFIFKNIHSLSSNNMLYISGAPGFSYMRTECLVNGIRVNNTWQNLDYMQYVESSNSSTSLLNITLNFYEDIEYEVIKYKHDFIEDPIVVNSGTINSYTFTNGVDDFDNGYLYTSNLGETVEIADTNSLEGLETIPSSIYPKQVVDLASFLTTYSGATYRTLSNPYYENDELVVTNLHTDTWVACNVTKNIPVDQNSAQNPNVDDLTDDDVKDVLKDIDDSTDNKDEDDIKSNEDTIEDEGTNDGELDPEDMINALAFSFLKQYSMSDVQMQDFSNIIFNQSGSFFGSIKNLFTNPIEGIINLQVAPEVLIPLDSTVEGMKINGVDVTDGIIQQVAVPKLNTNITKFEIGTLHIPKVFNTYQDITNSKLKLYLPFVGYLELDIALFLDRDILLKCAVDSLSGSIVYYIYVVDGENKRLIATPSGVCYMQIPLNGDATQNFLLGLIGGKY